MTNDDSLSILIPAKNEGDSIGSLIVRIQRIVSELTTSAEVLVIDAGSSDDTCSIALSLGAKVCRQKEPGYGGALRSGFAAASGQFIITMDADFSHDPVFLRSFWAHRHAADVLIASRYVPGGQSRTGLLRKFLSRLLNASYRWALSLPIRDLSSGFRMYCRELVVSPPTQSIGFEILEEIIIKLYAQGFCIREIPFEYRPRRYGTSKARLIQFGISLLKTLFHFWKLRNSLFFCDYDERAYWSRLLPQRYWQRRRYALVMELLETQNIRPTDTILDIGCGCSQIFQDLPGTPIGLDISLPKLRYLRKSKKGLVNGDLNALPFRACSVDRMICSQVIEHMPRADLEELNRVLKEGGLLVIGTPDYGRPYWPVIEWFYSKIIPAGYADEHINRYSLKRLAEELKAAGFLVSETRYILGAELIVKAVKVRPSRPVQFSG